MKTIKEQTWRNQLSHTCRYGKSWSVTIYLFDSIIWWSWIVLYILLTK